MDFVSLDTWTLIFTWCNLFILFLIMKKLLFKPIKNIIAQRENEVNSIYDKAESAQKEADSLKEEYTSKLANAKTQAAQIVKEANKTAQMRSDEIISDAKTQAATILTKAENEIEREKKAAMDDVKKDIASIAVSVAEKVIERDIKDNDYERLVEEFINNSGEKK